MRLIFCLLSVSIGFVLRLAADSPYNTRYWEVDGVQPDFSFQTGESIGGPTLLLTRGQSYDFDADDDLVISKKSLSSLECSPYDEFGNRTDVQPGCFAPGVASPMPGRQLHFVVPRNAPDLLFYSNRDGSVWGYLYVVGGLPYFRYFFPTLVFWFGCLIFELRVFQKKGLTGFGPRFPRRVGYATPVVAWTSRVFTVFVAVQMIVEVFVTIFSGCFWWVQVPLLFIQLYLLYAGVSCERSLVLWCPVITFLSFVYYLIFAFGISRILNSEDNGYQPTMTDRFYDPAATIAVLETCGFIFSFVIFCVMRSVKAARRLDYINPPPPIAPNDPPPPYAVTMGSEETPTTAPTLLIQCSQCGLIQGVLPTYAVVQCSQCLTMLATPGVNAVVEGVSLDNGYSGEGQEACKCCPARCCSLACYIVCGVLCLGVLGAIASVAYIISQPGFAKGRPFLVSHDYLPTTTFIQAPVLTHSQPTWLQSSICVASNATKAQGACHACPTTDLAPSLLTSLAEAWTRDAQAEHASVGSFARFTLQLLALGAPSGLVFASQKAGMEEVLHARFAFSLASAYAGRPLTPGKFPLSNSVTVSSSLDDLAFSTGEEGCLEETLSAVDIAVRAAAAKESCVSAGLLLLAEDEGRHAGLAWATLAWALRETSPESIARLSSRLQALFARSENPRNEQEEFAPPLGRVSVEGVQARSFVRTQILGSWLASLLNSNGTLAELPSGPSGQSSVVASIIAIIRAEFALLNSVKS